MQARYVLKWWLIGMAVLSCALPRISYAGAARNWPTLDGDVADGADIKALQYLLLARGYKVKVDGNFGQQTKNAVVKFQRSKRLIADGVVGNVTWEALVIKVKPGSKGNAVRAAQTMLRREGYNVPVDGIFGSQTKAAVKKLQSQRGITTDGIVGPYTWCVVVGGNIGEGEILGC